MPGRFFPHDKIRLRQDECAIIVDDCDNARIMGVLDKDGMIEDALENNRLGGLLNVAIAFVKNTGTIDVRWVVEGVFSIPDTLYENVAVEVRGCDGLIRCAICDAECFYRFFGVKKQKFGKRELGEYLSSRFKEKIAFVIGQIAQECKEEVEVVCSSRDRIAERLALSFDEQFKDESGLSVESVSISSGLIVDNDCPGKRMIQRIKEKRVETLSAAKTYLDEKRVLGTAGATKIEEEVIKNLSKSNARGASGVVAPLVSDYVNNEIAVVYCHKCGGRCKKGSNFCSRCGTNMQEA